MEIGAPGWREMKEIFKDLFDAELVWHEQEGPFYGTTFKNIDVQLRINDFPDYPWPITVIVGNVEQDLKMSMPKNWTLIDNDELKSQ